MECTYCGAELKQVDSYGKGRRENFYGTSGNGIYYPSTYEQLGNIYTCPNHEGFETEEEALKYMNDNNATFESLCVTCWEEIVCDSNCHHVSGSFYDDERGNLHEGYPC